MHFAFVDIAYGYTADRPDGNESLGGTTSAICFTARELVKAGITCTLFNKTRDDKGVHGVRSRPLDDLAVECVKPFYSAFIFCGRWMPNMVRLLRHNTKAPLIAWMHESHFDTKLVTALPEFDGVNYVSEWQKRINQPYIHPHWRQSVIRNAMSPFAADLFGKNEPILQAKTKPLTLLFAGTAPRGVMHVPPILDCLRRSHPNFTAEIYCNSNPSGDTEQDKKYIGWLRSQKNIAHVGMVGQKELAQRMKKASVLMAPNPWPETSCIALIEAMAAGLNIVTTNRAALPETAAGFARHIAIEDVDHPTRFDVAVPPAPFADSLGDAIDEILKWPETTEQKLRRQVDYCHDNYQWHQRVTPWIDCISSIKTKA